MTYSGDADQNIQLVRFVQVTGSEGSKVVEEIIRAEDAAHSSGHNGFVLLAVRRDAAAAGSDTDGDYSTVNVDSTGRLWCNVSNTVTVGSHAVTNAGTFAVQVDGSALTSLQLIDDAIYADEAAFTVASSKVMATGLHCVAHGSNPDAAAVDTVVNPLANRHRVPFHIGGHPNIVTVRLQFTAAQTDVSIVGTISTGTKVVVTGIQFTVDNASTVFPLVRVGFGATNTPTTTGVILAHGGVPAGGGLGRGDGSGIIGIGADGEELRITTTGTIGGNGGELVVSYYTIDS